MLVGLFNQDIGLSQSIALPKDSYLQDYFDDISKYLRTGPPVYFVIRDGYNYTDKLSQQKVLLNCNSLIFVHHIVVIRFALQLTVAVIQWVYRYPVQH